jgi:hypothetical protein
VWGSYDDGDGDWEKSLGVVTSSNWVDLERWYDIALNRTSSSSTSRAGAWRGRRGRGCAGTMTSAPRYEHDDDDNDDDGEEQEQERTVVVVVVVVVVRRRRTMI